MGKHSASGTSYWEARKRRKDLRKRGKPPKRRAPIKKRWLVLIFILGFAAGGVLGFYAKPIAKWGANLYLSIKSKQWQPTGKEKEEVEESLVAISEDPEESVNTLILGSDRGSNKGEGGWCRSDVMMLVCLHERDKKAVVISIPRDTKVTISGYGSEKINAANSYEGPSGAIDAVKDLLGVDIHHYISMDFEGFKDIVDAIGGVPIHLSKPINDPHAGYLPEGDLLLDGEQALVVVRSRKLPGGDVDRIKSQQAFLKALIEKAESMKSVWKAKQLVDIVARSCEMDYTAGELTALAEELQGFPITSIQFVTVPGKPKNISGVSYYVADEQLVSKLSAEVKSGTEISQELIVELESGSESTAGVEVLYGPGEDVVKVMSSCRSTVPAAPIVAQELRLLGHELVTEGQAKSSSEKTVMYHRREAQSICEEIKKQVPELADAELEYSDEVTSQHNSPVVIVLGSDFVTPNLISIYGRLLQPAVDMDNLGEKCKSIS